MSDIIIPGQSKKKPHVHDKIKQLAEHGWDDQKYLQEQYQLFLKAIQTGAVKDYHYNSEAAWKAAGSPCWGLKDTFEGWLKDVEEQVKFRIYELELRKKNSSQSMPQLITLIRQAQDAGEADLNVGGIGEPLSQEAYEAATMIYRKSLETIALFQLGKIQLLPAHLTEEERTESDNFIKKVLGGS